jgi:hypothetical protein
MGGEGQLCLRAITVSVRYGHIESFEEFCLFLFTSR